MPLRAIAAEAADEERNAIRARPPVGLADPTPAKAENTVTRCTAGGSRPTTSTPGTGRSSLICWNPISASPPGDDGRDRLSVDTPASRQQLRGDAETLEELGRYVHTAHARGIRDRFRGAPRAFQRVNRAGVGFRRSGSHGDADAGTREVDAAACDEAAGFDQVVDAGRRHDDDVRALAALQAIRNGVRRAGHRSARHDDEHQAGRALERRRQFLERGGHRAGGHHLDLVGLRPGSDQHEDKDRDATERANLKSI